MISNFPKISGVFWAGSEEEFIIIIIENLSEIYPAADEEVIENGYIVLKEDEILSVGAMDDEKHGNIQRNLQKDNSSPRKISGENMIAMPGMINTHTHTGMSILRGYADDLELMTWLQDKIWPMEAKMTAEDIEWGCRLAVLEMIKNGITAFNDMYFSMDRVARVVEKAGMRAQLGYGLIQENDGQKGLDYSREFIESYHNQSEGRLTCNVAPHAPYTCGQNYLKRVLDIAEDYGVNIHIHVSETENEVEDFKNSKGLSPVAYLDKLGMFEQDVIAVHCVHVSREDIELLAKRGAAVSHNPSSNTKLASGIAPVKEMREEGITVALGTDSSASNNSLDMVSEARMASYLQKVSCGDPTALDLNELFAMVTSEAAEVLGFEKVGRLEPGWKADLILVDKDKTPEFYPENNSISNLFYASGNNQVSSVYVDGKEIMYDGEVKTLEEEAIFAEINNRAKKLLE